MVKPIRGSSCSPDHIMVSINGDACTQMAVTWRCCTDIQSGYVLFREDGADDVMRCDAAVELFVSDIDESNLFSVLLTGLKPDTKYLYTCGNDEFRSEEFYFSTSPENLTKFKFICISDQQKGAPHDCPDYSYFNGFLKRVLEKHPDTRFFLTGGDNTDCGQHEVQWNGYFEGLKGISEHVPVMMTEGNHDTRGFRDYANGIGRYYSEPADFYCRQLKGAYPYNGPEGWKTENYYFDYGNVHFTVMGVNGPEDVNTWAIESNKNTDKTWKIGTYHFPICYSGTDCQNYDAYPVMTEAFEMYDIVFSGHEHNFARSFPLRGESLFDKPSQGTVHYMLGNSGGNPPGSRTIPKIWHTAWFPQEVPDGMVAVVEVDGNKMTLTSVLDDGRIVDQCIIDKDKDEILPHSLPPTFNRTRMVYKGADPGLCQESTPSLKKDGVWYCPLAILIAYMGGEVLKEKGKVTMSVYGHTATFFEDSDIAQTDRGELKLPAKVFRGNREQLYIPCDGCHAFEMRWAHAERNNFLSFEHESEDKPVTIQP